MKVAFLGPTYPWRGGIAQFAQNMAIMLENDGNDVMMFTYKQQYPKFIFPGSEQIDKSIQTNSLPAIKVLTPYNPLTWISTIKKIQDWSPDIIITQYWIPYMAPAYGFILRRIKQVKKLYIVHNVESHEKWFLANIASKYALLGGNMYVTLSEISTNALYKLSPKLSKNNIKQYFHPIYKKNSQSCNMSGKTWHRILFFGFVKHYKGLDILLEAMTVVLKEIPDVVLIIAGDVYGDKQIYLDLITNLAIKKNVETHFRYISDIEIAKFYSQCDISVIPYRSATQSGVAQMSFTYEIPVIATKVGGMEEIVFNNKNGFLVEPENPTAIAEAIIKFYNGDYIQRFKENIRKQNEQYSWDNFTQKLLRYIK